MKVSDVYSGRYLTAAEVSKPVTAMIEGVSFEEIGQDKQSRLILELKTPQGKSWTKGIVLNKTNANTLAEEFGDDTDAWTDCTIIVKAEKVQFQGKMVMGLRIAIPAAAPEKVPSAPESQNGSGDRSRL